MTNNGYSIDPSEPCCMILSALQCVVCVAMKYLDFDRQCSPVLSIRASSYLNVHIDPAKQLPCCPCNLRMLDAWRVLMALSAVPIRTLTG